MNPHPSSLRPVGQYPKHDVQVRYGRITRCIENFPDPSSPCGEIFIGRAGPMTRTYGGHSSEWHRPTGLVPWG